MRPTYSDLNSIISDSLVNLTATMRFPGQLTSSIKKIATNIIPFPRLKFILPSLAPLQKTPMCDITSFEIVEDLLDPNKLLVSADPRYGNFYTAAGIFRGDFSPGKVSEQLNDLKVECTNFLS